MVDIKPEQVPKKVVRAAEKSWEKDTESFRPNAKTIAAALNAWPGMHLGAPWVIGVPNATSIILPLTPQENSDE